MGVLERGVVVERRMKRDDRRRALVDAAYQVIAARGFEGLRTRAVAARARVNVATLHYYFSGKEALVRGVTEYITEQLRAAHAPVVGNRSGAALRRLRQELAGVSYYHAKRRELVAVMLELMQRAQRDPVLHRSLRRVLRRWRNVLRQIVTAGIREGTLRPDLDPEATATTVAALVAGLALIAGRSDRTRARAEIERWLTSGRAPADEREAAPTATDRRGIRGVRRLAGSVAASRGRPGDHGHPGMARDAENEWEARGAGEDRRNESRIFRGR